MMLYEDLKDIEAIKYFDKCDEYDADERLLICYYRAKNIKEFESRLLKIKQNKPNSRIIASLANHYAYSYEIDNPYNFCNEPLEYIYQNKLTFEILKVLKFTIQPFPITKSYWIFHQESY